jgi:hypothetical protein
MESIPQHIFFRVFIRNAEESFHSCTEISLRCPLYSCKKKANPGHAHICCNPSQGLRLASLASGLTKQEFFGAMHSGTGLIYEMVLVKKLKLEASGHECRKQYS